MITNELVMAVLCHPLSMKELLQTEKTQNVIILRRLDYNEETTYFSPGDYVPNIAISPVKLMFVFNGGEAVVVNNYSDKLEVQQRLEKMHSHLYA
jgi:hypothetical protein